MITYPSLVWLQASLYDYKWLKFRNCHQIESMTIPGYATLDWIKYELLIIGIDQTETISSAYDPRQLFRACYHVTYMEKDESISPNTTFKIVFIAFGQSLDRQTFVFFKKMFPKKLNSVRSYTHTYSLENKGFSESTWNSLSSMKTERQTENHVKITW